MRNVLWCFNRDEGTEGVYRVLTGPAQGRAALCCAWHGGQHGGERSSRLLLRISEFHTVREWLSGSPWGSSGLVLVGVYGLPDISVIFTPLPIEQREDSRTILLQTKYTIQSVVVFFFCVYLHGLMLLCQPATMNEKLVLETKQQTKTSGLFYIKTRDASLKKNIAAIFLSHY